MILVVGDIIVDIFHYCKKIGVSAETPTIVGEEETCDWMLGGAGLIARHLNALGSQCKLLTVCEPCGDLFLTPCDIEMELVEKLQWKDTVKDRYFVDGYKLLQLDKINRDSHSDESENAFLMRFNQLVDEDKVDTVIIADNRHGTINRNIARYIINNKAGLGYRVFVDSQYSQYEPNHLWYRGADCIFLNDKEFNYWKRKVGPKDEKSLSTYLNSNIVHKRGENGSSAFIRGEQYDCPGFITGEVIDTCGAGDAFLASYASSNKDEYTKLMEANKYASFSCTFKGTQTPTKEEYEKFISG